MNKDLMKTPIRIIDADSKKLISTGYLRNGQTYNIPEGYDLIDRTISDSLETCYVRKKC